MRPQASRRRPSINFWGCEDEELRMKVRGLLELLNEGIARYHTLTGAKGFVAKDGDGQGEKLNWDGALSR